MIYRNKVTGEFKVGNITDISELVMYESDDIIKNNKLNIDYILCIMPSNEFTSDEIDLLSKGSISIPYIHLKTGHRYNLTNISVECTNGHEDEIKCIYHNTDNLTFTRDFNEFFKKFKRE